MPAVEAGPFGDSKKVPMTQTVEKKHQVCTWTEDLCRATSSVGLGGVEPTISSEAYSAGECGWTQK